MSQAEHYKEVTMLGKKNREPKVERRMVRAFQLRAGDRARMPEGEVFYELVAVWILPSEIGEGSDVIADAGWGTCRLAPMEQVEIEVPA